MLSVITIVVLAARQRDGIDYGEVWNGIPLPTDTMEALPGVFLALGHDGFL